jgi:hypothetical protein
VFILAGEVLALKGNELMSALVITNNIIEQLRSFSYFGCHLGSNRNYDLQNKLQRFNYLYGKMKRILLNRSEQETI